MIRLRKDIPDRLAEIKFNSYTAKKSKLFGAQTFIGINQDAQSGQQSGLYLESVNTLCVLLGCGIDGVLEYVEDPEEIAKAEEAWPGLAGIRENRRLQAEVDRLRSKLANLEAGMRDGSAPGEAQ